MIITGTYNVEALRKWSQSQTRTELLEADTTGAPVIINLPEIADIDAVNGSGVKILVHDFQNNASANIITINAGGTDTIGNDATTSLVINTDGGMSVLTIVNGAWSVESGSPATPALKDAFLWSQAAAAAPTLDETKMDGIPTAWTPGRSGVGIYTFTSVEDIDATKIMAIAQGNGPNAGILSVTSIADAFGKTTITVTNDNTATGPADTVDEAVLMIWYLQ